MNTRIRIAALTMAALVTAALGVLAMTLPSAAADEDIAWSVVPSSPNGPDGRVAFDYEVEPGTVISDWVAVTNLSVSAYTFRIYAADAVTDYATAAFTLIGSDQSSTDAGSWTSIDGAPTTCPDETPEEQAACPRAIGIDVTLQPGQRADIPFTVTVPFNAAPGDHAAGIVAVHTLEGAGESGASVRQETRQGTRLYVRVDGELQSALTVSGLVSGFESSWIPFAPGTGRVDFDIANTGNTRVSVQPVARLRGPFGIDLGTWELTDVANLLPGATAHVGVDVPNLLPLLMISSEVSVVPEVADGEVAASDRVAPRYTATTDAWAIPWTGLALIVLLAAGIAAVVVVRRRSTSRLAEDLAAFRERVLAEDRAARLTDSNPKRGDR